ncbi:MAG: hypothetical protein IAB19_01275 [Proteobacteria bacterium]|uniref:Uncharacterized protein n=1 Tax=Candidatus Avisuccinivibrio stercorigallinarum TaxID=2840704 RepID=A0A9D9GSE8_9GAMM|nr:hypothetical protein [Candidatus Avisuccinivibrio stercorigallinarum]
MLKLKLKAFTTALLLCTAALMPALAAGADTEPEEVSLKDLIKTESASFTLAHLPYILHYQKPAALHETVIASDKVLSLSYSGLNNRLLVTVSMNADPSLASLFTDYSAFKDYALKPFSDKEKLMYGEYELTDEQTAAGRWSISFYGYLKKPEDGILPAMYNFLEQRLNFEDGTLVSAQCQIQGAPEQQLESRALFKELRPLCEAVISDLSLEHKGK